MVKRRSLLRAAASLPLAAALSTSKARDLSRSAPQALLFILADDMRWDAYGAAGYHALQTTHIDWLARTGQQFQNHFVTTSICPTSRASIFTGQYARRHGIWDFSSDLTETQLAQSLPATLKAAGFTTGFFGKWGIGTTLPVDWFDHWQGFAGQGHYVQGEDLHLTDLIAKQATTWLNQLSSKDKVAIFISTKAPHVQDEIANGFISASRYRDLYTEQVFQTRPNVSAHSYANLPRFLQTSEGRTRWQHRFQDPAALQATTRKYHQLIKGVDDLVGDVLRTMEKRFGLSTTLTVFTSDNGFFLGEHGLAGKWWGFEEAIRTPLVIKAPGFKPASSQQMSLNIDLMPTILDLLAVPHTSEKVQGQSLVPDLKGVTRQREAFFYEHLFEHPRIAKTIGLRTASHKYLHYPDYANNDMLFDLNADPYELTNLAQQPAAQNLIAQMRAKTLQLQDDLA
jgi:arylsulfatase A-like enzyme